MLICVCQLRQQHQQTKSNSDMWVKGRKKDKKNSNFSICCSLLFFLKQTILKSFSNLSCWHLLQNFKQIKIYQVPTCTHRKHERASRVPTNEANNCTTNFYHALVYTCSQKKNVYKIYKNSELSVFFSCYFIIIIVMFSCCYVVLNACTNNVIMCIF